VDEEERFRCEKFHDEQRSDRSVTTDLVLMRDARIRESPSFKPRDKGANPDLSVAAPEFRRCVVVSLPQTAAAESKSDLTSFILVAVFLLVSKDCNGIGAIHVG